MQRILIISKNKYLIVISIPQTEVSFKTKIVTIYSFLGISCSNTLLVQPNQDILKDVLVLVEKPVVSYNRNLPTPDLSSRTERADITIYDSSILTRVSAYVPLFKNHDITQRRIDNRTVMNSITCYHHLY